MLSHSYATHLLESGLIEIIKYGCKIFTEPDLKKRAKETAYIYLKVLDAIFKAMKGKRIFDRFGFNTPKETGSNITAPTLLRRYDEWVFILWLVFRHQPAKMFN